MSPTDDLRQHLEAAPHTIISVLETFQVTRSFVAAIDDYIRSTRFTNEWYGFLDRYAILMWESRDICTDSRFQLIKLNDVLKFAKQDNPNMDAIKAKVTDYSNTPFKTNEKAQNLVDDLKKLDEDISEWKVDLSDVLETKIPKQDDGSSSYRMLMKALKDLKERLPPDDRNDMKSVLLADTMRPATVSTLLIQETWLKFWFEVDVIVRRIKRAPDAVTMTKLQLTIAGAYSDYQPLDGVCGSYADELHRGLYHAYTSAVRRQR